MLEMVDIDRQARQAAEVFRVRQSDFDRAKETLDQELAQAFGRLFAGKAGDRISATVAGRSSPPFTVEGRAVIMRNGTQMGLYVHTDAGDRYSVQQPYSAVKILARKKRGHHPARKDRW